MVRILLLLILVCIQLRRCIYNVSYLCLRYLSTVLSTLFALSLFSRTHIRLLKLTHSFYFVVVLPVVKTAECEDAGRSLTKKSFRNDNRARNIHSPGKTCSVNFTSYAVFLTVYDTYCIQIPVPLTMPFLSHL